VNPDLKLLKIYDKLSGRMDLLEDVVNRVEKLEGPTGPEGNQGPKGEDGRDGKDGVDGKDGKDGLDGKDGDNGADGVSVVDAEVDIDGHLVLKLSDGNIIDAGEVLAEAVEGDRTVVNYSGGFGRNISWIEYTANWSSEPTLIYTQPDGSEVYLYTYDNGVLYRFVPSDLSVRRDGFYRKFEDNDVTSLVIERGMRI
jgi:hypothetical protein